MLPSLNREAFVAIVVDGKAITGLFRGWEEKGTKVLLLLEEKPSVLKRYDSSQISEAYLGIPEPSWKGNKNDYRKDDKGN
ncbi:MAG: hypothetical protein LKG11_00875 [Bacilli bacterium]|jgi:hypothetical protein|nr:hypothetical protein [Bacilli bacterium]